MKKHLTKTFFAWIPFAVVITLLCGLLYAGVQQDIRQAANDPQIQVAQDAADALAAGANPQNIIPPYQMDITKSLSPYIMLISDQGETIVSSGILNDKQPTLPAGVFAYTKTHGEDRFTWQPEKGVRSAMVIDRVQNASGTLMGYIAVGRSLSEVERRESAIARMIAIGWVITLALTLIAIAAVEMMQRKWWQEVLG